MILADAPIGWPDAITLMCLLLVVGTVVLAIVISTTKGGDKK